MRHWKELPDFVRSALIETQCEKYPARNSSACTGLSRVTITNTFTSAVPQIVQLAAGGTTLTATACYPNNS